MSAPSVTVDFTYLPHGEGLAVPQAQSAEAAGLDLCAAVAADVPVVLQPGAYGLVPCGFAMALPAGYEAQVRPRSGLAAKYGVSVLNAPGTIDADYRGEVKVILINYGSEPFTINRGDRIAQMVVAPVTRPEFAVVADLPDTPRGANGFGSTGHAAAE